MAPPKKGPFSGQRIPQTFNVDNHFDRYYIVKRISEKDETFQTVSPFLVQKAISATIGEPNSIRKIRSGDLLIEVNSRMQAQQLQKIKALATIPVRVTPHILLNTSKGVITCGEILNLPVDLIAKELKSQGVTHVRRITIRRDGETIETKHHILTFMSPKLPESIYVGYIKRPVRPYIPNPLRCFNCQRFGHSKANCRGTITCARCAERGHESQECSAQEKCVNCKGNHTSFSRSCPRWQLEKEITAVKIKELSYPEARKKVLSQTPSPGISYASVVRKIFCKNCACQNCTKSKNPLPSLKPSSDSDSDKSIVNNHDTEKSETIKRKPSKSEKSLKLKLAKRGVSKTNLSTKFKKSATKNSVALGLASQGIAHKDLTSIFGGIPNCPDLKLHHSGDESEFEMSCEVSATPVVAPNNSSATHIS
ncbi:uncharacterized protein LOC129966460 [Argiope bruennichi]|uniref:uncharacterized protein LOC129966460 n=1 Tax=Argiope bruennichi TaxID=94029 RepID=UPI0024949840|nr:uncharacterized protein LOC129966460 [Argiope bruennichi]